MVRDLREEGCELAVDTCDPMVITVSLQYRVCRLEKECDENHDLECLYKCMLFNSMRLIVNEIIWKISDVQEREMVEGSLRAMGEKKMSFTPTAKPNLTEKAELGVGKNDERGPGRRGVQKASEEM